MQFRRLFMISRPVGWFLLPPMFLLGIAEAGRQVLGWQMIVEAVIVSFPLCLIACGLNDIYDQRTDELNPRKGGVHGVRLKSSEVRSLRQAVVMMVACAVVAAGITANVWNMLAMLVLLFFAIAYSIPPLRLKERPPLDSLSNGIIFITPFFLGATFGTLSYASVYKASLLGVAIVAIHMFSTIMDVTPDKRAGQVTFATRFGCRRTALLSASVVLGVMIAGRFSHLPINVYLALAVLTMMLTALLPAAHRERAGRRGFILLTSAYYLCICWLIALRFRVA